MTEEFAGSHSMKDLMEVQACAANLGHVLTLSWFKEVQKTFVGAQLCWRKECHHSYAAAWVMCTLGAYLSHAI